jgi:hypothetical protein
MVLLVLGVVVTVGLALVSRSITEVNISAVEDESTRALEAAEAGIEKALGGVIAIGGGSGSLPQVNASYNVTSTQFGAGDAYEPPLDLSTGDVATIILEGEDASGSPARYNSSRLVLCWKGQGPAPGVEVILYFRNTAATPVYYVGRAGYDSDAVRAATTSFSTSGVISGGCISPLNNSGYMYRKQIHFNSELGMPAGPGYVPVFLRVKPIFNTSPWKVGVVKMGPAQFPVQGTDVSSVGQSGDASQKLRVIQTKPDLSTMFDSALFSGSALVQ